MKVIVSKDTYEYFRELIAGDGQRLIENWREYIENDTHFKFWGELYGKVIGEVELSSAQMVAKLLRGEIEIEEKKEPTRFVYYKERGIGSGNGRRYYGGARETDEALGATHYKHGISHDERHMSALETLGWTKITLDEAIVEDESK